MRLEISKLRKVTGVLLDHIEDLGYKSVDVKDDYYWDIQATEQYAVFSDPAKPTIGQLSDDWVEIEKILANERDPSAYALVWLSALLRYVGEQIVA